MRGWFVLSDDGVVKTRFPLSRDEKDPLGLSIKKWQFIVDCLEGGRLVVSGGGIQTCSLCVVAGDTCGPCLVYEKTGVTLCRGTPYLAWAEYLSKERKYDIGRLLVLAKAELEFLKSLKEVEES